MEILTLQTKKEILKRIESSVTLITEYSNLRIEDVIGLLTTTDQLKENTLEEFKVDIRDEINTIKELILAEDDSAVVIELFDYLIQKIEEFIQLNTQTVPFEADLVDTNLETLEITDSQEIIETYYSFDEIIRILQNDYDNPMINKCKFTRFLSTFDISKESTAGSHTQYYINLEGRDIRFLSTPLANKSSKYQVHFANIISDIQKKTDLAPQISEVILTMVNNGVKKLYKKI